MLCLNSLIAKRLTLFIDKIKKKKTSLEESLREAGIGTMIDKVREEPRNSRTSDSLNEGLPIKMTREKFQRK